MNINPSIEKPIFMQIADEIEDAIFTGIYAEEGQIPSTNEISAIFNINPHTVLKGMNILVSAGLIYKKRGIGMFVSEGAKEKITGKRKSEFYSRFIIPLIRESEKLAIDEAEIQSLIEKGFNDGENRD